MEPRPARRGTQRARCQKGGAVKKRHPRQPIGIENNIDKCSGTPGYIQKHTHPHGETGKTAERGTKREPGEARCVCGGGGGEREINRQRARARRERDKLIKLNGLLPLRFIRAFTDSHVAPRAYRGPHLPTGRGPTTITIPVQSN